MMTKNKVVLDVDDVLGEFLRELNIFYNSLKGTNFSFEDYQTYSLHDVWGISPEESIEIIHEFYKSPKFSRLEPLEFSRDVLKDLKSNYEFIAASYRPEMLTGITREWIGDYFSEVSDVFCVGSYDFSGPLESKLEVCRRVGGNTIVEDNARTAIECAQAGLNSILLDKPWNEKVSGNGFKRIRDWREVPEEILNAN